MSPSVPAPLALLELIESSIVTQALYTAAKLGVADTLGSGPLTADQIADRVSADPESVYRLLRMLASRSVFAERDDGRFELTPMADALRTDAPLSMRRIALLMGHPIHWEDWGHLEEAVRTGEPSLPKLRGMSAWEFFQSNPEYGAVFFAGMGNLSDLETDAVAGAIDYSRFGKIIDVGGGSGTLLAAILQKAADAKGVVFAPSSVDAAQEVLDQAGVAGRCAIEEGSFFESVPAGADAYLLKHVVHDLPEPQALQLLGNVRKAISPKGSLLLMEFVLPGTGNTPHPGKLVDLWLMLLVGGKERTSEQYRELFAKAGFRLTGVTETPAGISIVEAQPS
jgi:O-methyltransferase/methyltransferase family protein